VKRTCSATNRRGEPCGSRAVTPDGRCAIHGGLVDPSELGRKGGKASGRARSGLGPDVVDADLRERARNRLYDMLDSDNEATRLSAAKSLFSYATTPAPSGYAAVTPAPSVSHDWKEIRAELWECGVDLEAPRLDEMDDGAVQRRIDECKAVIERLERAQEWRARRKA
jgi:hypothetical protein